MTTEMWLLKDFDTDCIENCVGKGEIAHFEQFHLYVCPSKTGCIMGSPVAGRQAGGQGDGRVASSSLSGAYLQNYTSYCYEILWVDRSHQGRVQCT